MSQEFKVVVPVLEEQTSRISAAGSGLALHMSTDGGTKTSKTVTNCIKAIESANTFMTSLAAEITLVSSDLTATVALARQADSAASCTVTGLSK